MSKVLFVGEQAQTWTLEFKGADYFGVGGFHPGGRRIRAALEAQGHQLDWIMTCNVTLDFPEELSALQKYDVILVSDVGSNTFYFHPEMLKQGIRHPNRLALIRDYVAAGGGMAMIGGWMSFAGMDGRAKYHGSALEEALPVECLPYDDRMERPEGCIPQPVDLEHPILKGLPKEWPYFLGYNKVIPKMGSTPVLMFEKDPLLVVGHYGKGRSAAFTSDCAPHWGPAAFMDWPGYAPLWGNLVNWLAGR